MTGRRPLHLIAYALFTLLQLAFITLLQTLQLCGGAGKALAMATHTLQQMAQGGMYDQIGGGFHRYSVDDFWHIPHFEKMLYDNPQLASTYLDAFALTGDRQYAEVARGVLDYLMRDMTHPLGGIFSAEVR